MIKSDQKKKIENPLMSVTFGPNPEKLGVHFSESLYPYEHKVGIKNNFHHLPSDLTAG